MFTPIHQALGLEPGRISIELIEQAIESKVKETASLDWKKAVYHTNRKDWQDEAAKDIAAMANSGGGWIVFGVEEESKSNSASEITPIEWNSNEQQRLLRVAYAHIGPPVLGLEFFAFPKDEGYVVMMRVPDSHDAPHFARKGNDAFVAPRRNGPHTAFMSDREIERGFRERFQYREDNERQLQEIYEQTGKVLNPIEGVCLVAVAVPNEPSSLQAFPEGEASRFTVPYPEADQAWVKVQPLPLESGKLRKGMRQWIIREDNSGRFIYRKFLSNDGTVACVYRLGGTINDEQAKPYYPVGQPNHCMSSHVESVMIDFFSVLREFAATRHTNSGFHLRVGLVGNPDKPIFIRTIEYPLNFITDESYSEPIITFQPVTVELDPLAPFNELLSVATDLVQDIINQGNIRNLQVIADSSDSNP